jgi:hypothetical protein
VESGSALLGEWDRQRLRVLLTFSLLKELSNTQWANIMAYAYLSAAAFLSMTLMEANLIIQAAQPWGPRELLPTNLPFLFDILP